MRRWVFAEESRLAGQSQGDRLRRQLFERGAAAVAQLFPALPPCYICPLCTYAFTSEALALKLLSDDHVPARRALAGPRLRVLTCTSCNNFAGQVLDQQMARGKAWRD